MTAVDPLIEQIERVRKERRLSTQHLADAAGVARSTFDHARRGANGVTLHTLRALAASLGLEVRLAPMILRELAEQFDALKPAPAPRPPVTPAQQERNLTVLNEALSPRWRGRPT